MEDRYVLYVLGAGINDDFFWYEPYGSVERVYEGKLAFDGWRNSPK